MIEKKTYNANNEIIDFLGIIFDLNNQSILQNNNKYN